MSHVSLDIETLGTSPGAVVFSLGAVRLPVEGPVYDEFYTTISVADSLAHGLVLDPKTLAWWLEPKDARAFAELRAALRGDAPSLTQAFGRFFSWVKREDLIWAFPATFDCVLVREAAAKVGLRPPYNFKNERCLRTLAHAKLGENRKLWGRPAWTGPALAEHHALDDAREQAELLKRLLEGAA